MKGLWDTQPDTIHNNIIEPMTILRDGESTGAWEMGVECEGVHSKGRQRDVVKRRMERRVGREEGQDLQVDLGPGHGLVYMGQV